MANCSSNGAQLPVILIVDMDNQVEEFIIFNPPSGPGSAINSAKLKEGTSNSSEDLEKVSLTLESENPTDYCVQKVKHLLQFSNFKDCPDKNPCDTERSSDIEMGFSSDSKVGKVPMDNRALAILAKSLAQMSEDKMDKDNPSPPVWKKLHIKDVVAQKETFNGIDEWDKVDEKVAIGRRIYDRSEVEVKWLTNLEEVPAVIRMKTLDMKEIAETFGLWDEVYQKEVVKELEASQLDQTVQSASPTIPQKQIINQQQSQKQSQIPKLTKEEMSIMVKSTKFDVPTIKQWHKAFFTECPSGELTKNHLNQILHHLFPDGNSKSFCDAVFRTFSAGDSRSYEFLNFKEFLNAMNITSLKSEQEKLQWAFRLYDADGSGSINVKEISSIIKMMDEMEGSGENPEDETISQRAEELFGKLDRDGDGEITMDEFVQGYIKMRQSLAPIRATVVNKKIAKSKSMKKKVSPKNVDS